MNTHPLFSIIIPTYNRAHFLLKILTKLCQSPVSFEIIICDSNSLDQTKKKIKFFARNCQNRNIRYYDIKDNNNSKKRNFGLKKSLGEYIIFLDDDCIPSSRYLNDCKSILDKNRNNNKVVFCGSVKYFFNEKNNNFLEYRQSRHFIINNKETNYSKSLHPRNVVTMNMFFKKKTLFENKVFFNENFNRYGFEDYEFAYRLRESGIEMAPCSPFIYHLDNRDFKKFLMKIIFLGQESKNFLIKINKKASLENNFIILENNFLIKILINIKFIDYLMILIQNLFLFLEKKIKFHGFFYKFLIANAYLMGCVLSKKYKKNSIFFNEWYK